ncbi:hypothetical protein Bbelb_318550 [Branchiostoma belcheri]|nr:hypothetical protein Bbelb_318550 [Branchiostoma belcheri]
MAPPLKAGDCANHTNQSTSTVCATVIVWNIWGIKNSLQGKANYDCPGASFSLSEARGGAASAMVKETMKKLTTKTAKTANETKTQETMKVQPLRSGLETERTSFDSFLDLMPERKECWVNADGALPAGDGPSKLFLHGTSADTLHLTHPFPGRGFPDMKEVYRWAGGPRPISHLDLLVLKT